MKLLQRRIVLGIALAVLGGFVALNVMAYIHAHAMLYFTSEGERTKSPEELAGLEKVVVLLTGINMPHPRNDVDPADLGLPFHTVTIRTADDFSLEGWWIPHPEPKGAVALFHGYAGSKSTLLAEAKTFYEFGYSCLLVDQRGCGGSSGDYTSIGYHEAEDVQASVAYLRQKLDAFSPIILYGQSMGGVSVFRALAMHRIDASAVIVEGIYDDCLNAIRNRFRSMGLPAFPSAELLGFWGGVQLGFFVWEHSPRKYASEIRIPVLMLHGTNDPRATITQARRVFSQLRGSKKLVEFPGIGHGSLKEPSSSQWIEAVEVFLDEAVISRDGT